MEPMKHLLITIEGTDGSGKKTQVKKLYDYLKSKKYEVLVVSFPNYESLSSGPVRMYLGGEFGEAAECFDAYQASAMYAVDRMCTMKKLMAGLTQDTVIIFDRYTQSNMIHQAGKIKGEEELDRFLEWLDKLEFETMRLPRPDKVIFLDVPVEVSYKITTAREQMKIGEAWTYDIHERDKRHLVDSYLAGKYVAQKYGWDVINCAAAAGELKSIDEIHALIKAAVKPMLK
jgi:dTMP kinase